VENRTRNIAGDYQGLVAIHAGLAEFEQDNMASRAHSAAHGTQVDSVLVFGAIIGVVDLVGVHDGPHRSQVRFENVESCFQPGKPFGSCSPWAEDDTHHLVLKNPRPLATPIPHRGMLGLQKVTPELEARILAGVRS
jgi:hypothetical protein